MMVVFFSFHIFHNVKATFTNNSLCILHACPSAHMKFSNHLSNMSSPISLILNPIIANHTRVVQGHRSKSCSTVSPTPQNLQLLLDLICLLIIFSSTAKLLEVALQRKKILSSNTATVDARRMRFLSRY